MYKYQKYSLELVCDKVCESPYHYNGAITDPRQITDYLNEVCRLHMKPEENFIVVAIDNKANIIGYSIISIGTIAQTMVHPREVFKFALMCNAASIIVAHNHPSGDVIPSKEDIRLTNRLIEAGKIMGIPVIDHIIVGDDNYYSMVEEEIFGE